MTRAARLLHAQGHAVWSVPPDASVYEAIKLMADKEVGPLLVIDGQRLVGIVS
jgi:CBS domain-containing protein